MGAKKEAEESSARRPALRAGALAPARARPRRNSRTKAPNSGLSGAGDGARTRDIQLGKLTLYQLSYSREARLDSMGGRGAQGVTRGGGRGGRAPWAGL